MLRVCIVGPGAIGGHMAIRLAKGGATVVALARGKTLEALSSAPAVLDADDGSEHLEAQIRVSDFAKDLGVQDIVVFAVKFDALPTAIDSAKPLFGKDTIGVFAMNGLPWWFGHGLSGNIGDKLEAYLDPTGALRRALDWKKWIACVVTSGNRVTRPGAIINYTPRNNSLSLGGSAGAPSETLLQFSDIAGRGGYKVDLPENIREKIWAKLLINSSLSAISTICERNTNETCTDPDTRMVAAGVITEMLEIGNQLGLELHVSADKMTDPKTIPFHVTSFLQDLLNDKPLEIYSGILGVREIARYLNIDAPYVFSVAALLAARSPKPGLSSAQRREKLLA